MEGVQGQPAGLCATPGGRRALFFALYFLEGAPIGFVWWTLPALLARAGQGPAAVGALTSMLVLPWAFKFVAAPLVDLLRGPRWSYRAWISVAQAGMALSLLPLLRLDLVTDLTALRNWLLLHACCAALQDVSIDALAIRVTPPSERGRLNGWAQAGMLLSRGGVAGFALGWGAGAVRPVVLGLLALLLLGQLLHCTYRAPAPTPARRATAANAREYRAAISAVLRRPLTWAVLGLALLSGASFEMVGGQLGPFMLHVGASEGDLARFYAGPALFGLGGGALLGGWIADRVGAPRTMGLSGAATAFAVLAATLVGGTTAVWIAVGLVFLCAGAFTAASYALYMDATDPRLAATQFSATMGVTNLCESWSVRVAGRVAESASYARAFQLGAWITLASLALLLLMRRGARGG